MYVSVYKKWIVDLSKSNMKYMIITEKSKEESKNYCGLSILFNNSIQRHKYYKYA